MRRKVIVSISFLVVIFIFFIILTPKVSAKEDEIISRTLSESQIINVLNAANTYNVSELSSKSATKYNGDKINYKLPVFNMNDKNDNLVSPDTPQVTILTHGLGGSANNWGYYDNDKNWKEDTIVEFLSSKTDVNIYHAKVLEEPKDVFEYALYDITSYIDEKNTNAKNIENIDDNSKHSIVIFSGYETFTENDYIYIINLI